MTTRNAEIAGLEVGRWGPEVTLSVTVGRPLPSLGLTCLVSVLRVAEAVTGPCELLRLDVGGVITWLKKEAAEAEPTDVFLGLHLKWVDATVQTTRSGDI